jgi:hypothetical protein
MTKATKKTPGVAHEKIQMPGWKALTSLQIVMHVFVFLFSGTTLVGTVCFLTVFPTSARQPVHVASDTIVSYRGVGTLPVVAVANDDFLDPIIVTVNRRPPPPTLVVVEGGRSDPIVAAPSAALPSSDEPASEQRNELPSPNRGAPLAPGGLSAN